MSPSFVDHSCSTDPGARKQTPPVSTEEPPTHSPIITLMTGESPSGIDAVIPPSRQMCRIVSLGRIRP